MQSFKQFLNIYKFYIISFFIFVIISNLQIKTLENKFNNLYEGIHKVKVIGTVISDRKETTYKSSYTIKVESVNSNYKFDGTNLIIYASKKESLEYGDKVTINGIYEKASTAKNYKAFDYREYLKSKNVYGIVNAEDIKVIKKSNLNFVLMGINNLRISIKSNLQKILGEEAKITTRNTSSEIHQKYQMKL